MKIQALAKRTQPSCADQVGTRPPRRVAWLGRCLLVVVIGALTVGNVSVTQAQSLDRKVLDLLRNQCAGLGLNPPVPTAAALGGNLLRLCSSVAVAAPGPLVGSSAIGGNGGAIISASVSVLNRPVTEHLQDRWRDTEGNQGNDTNPSTLQWTPLAVIPAQLFGLSNASVSTSPQSPTGAGAVAFSTQERWKNFGFYVSGRVEALNRNLTTFQYGYRSNILGITAGVDYRFAKNLVAGAAFTYSNTHGDLKTVTGGNFDINTYNPTLYASWMPTDRTFVQTVAGYRRLNNSVSRPANAFIDRAENTNSTLVMGSDTAAGFASSRVGSDVFELGLLTGYDLPIKNFTIGPRVGLNWSNTRIPRYSEQGETGLELRYDRQSVNSLQSILGLQAQAAFSTAMGVLVPQVNWDYIHEYANSQRFVHVQFVQDLRATPTQFTFQNDAPARNYFLLGTGLLAVLPNGWQPFVNFRAMVGNSQFTNYVGFVGLRVGS